jgi:hypothetical protein
MKDKLYTIVSWSTIGLLSDVYLDYIETLLLCGILVQENHRSNINFFVKPRTPPDPDYCCFRLFFILYMLINCFQVHAIFHEDLPISSLCAIPMVVFCGSSIMSIHRYKRNRATYKLFHPSPCDPTNNVNLDYTSFITTSCHAKKLAMLSAWQTTNE